MIAVSAAKETQVQKDIWTFFPQLNWENRPEEKEKKEEKQAGAWTIIAQIESICRARAQCSWMDFYSVVSCLYDAFT